MEYTTQELLIGIQEKDTEVFRYLYKYYGGMIAGYVRKNSGSEEDAVEMIQVVMLELWMAVQNGRYNEEGKLANYIYQLTSNSWRDELRKRKKRSSEALSDGELQLKDDSEIDLVHAIVKDKQLNAIHEAMGQLGEVCRDIIQMYHLQKIRLQEIAERLEYDYDNLRKRIFDCRKKLKQLTEGILAKDVQE
jgi:RNA polymerase sigma factor (sigma-70 family)